MVYEFGNDEYLAHHGVDGQKWGVKHGPPYPLSRSAKQELKQKAKEQKKEEKETKKFAKRLKYYGDNPYYSDFNKLADTPQIKAIASQVKKSWDKIGDIEKQLKTTEKDFYKRKDYEKWVRVAAQRAYDEYGKNSGSTFDDYLWGFLYDDLDQGMRTTQSFDIWLKESGAKEAKAYLNNEKKAQAAREAYRSECKDAVKGFLGKYGDNPAGYMIGVENGKATLRQRTLTDKGADLVSDILSNSANELKQLEYMDWLEEG